MQNGKHNREIKLIELALFLVFGGMLWTREYENKREAKSERPGKLFYTIKYGTVALCVLLIVLITKARFF